MLAALCGCTARSTWSTSRSKPWCCAFGKYYETVGPGLNIYFPPIDRKYLENVTRERAYTKQGQMLTEDENIVEVPLTKRSTDQQPAGPC